MAIIDMLKKQANTLTEEDLERLERRDGFTNLLPFLAYDPAERIYRNTDETCGCAWECDGIGYMSSEQQELLAKLVSIKLPADAVLQFVLYGSSNIDEELAKGLNACVVKSGPAWERAKAMAIALKKTANGEVPGRIARSCRLFVTVKLDAASHDLAELTAIRDQLEAELGAAGMNPRPLQPGRLLGAMRQLFNNMTGIDQKMLYSYDDQVPLRKQVILSETKLLSKAPDFISGGKAFHCFTPFHSPETITPLAASEIVGSSFNLIPGIGQIESDYIYCLNIIQDDIRSSSEKGHEKQKKIAAAADGAAPGSERKMAIFPAFLIIDNCPERLERSRKAVDGIWQSIGFICQEELALLRVMVLGALPFGFYHIGQTCVNIRRHLWRDSGFCAALLPVQCGSGVGGLLVTTTNKGEVSGTMMNTDVGINDGPDSGTTILNTSQQHASFQKTHRYLIDWLLSADGRFGEIECLNNKVVVVLNAPLDNQDRQ